MADVKFDTTRVMLLQGTGSTQDITIAGFGVPKAAIFIWSMCNAGDNTPIGSSSNGYAFTDGTTQWGSTTIGSNNNGTSTTPSSLSNVRIASKPEWSNVGEDYGSTYTAFITDGVTITITDSATYDTYLTVVLIGGDDIAEVYCGAKGGIDAATASQYAVLEAGFRPNLLFTSNSFSSPPSGTSAYYNGAWSQGFGIALDDGVAPFAQAGHMGFNQNGAATTNTRGSTDTDRIMRVRSPSVETSWKLPDLGFSSTGFYLDRIGAAANLQTTLSYLAIRFSTVPRMSLSQFTFPTAGNVSLTGLSFAPAFGLISGNSSASGYNLTESTYGNCGPHITTFTDAAIYSNSSSSKAGLSTSAEYSNSAQSLSLITADGTTGTSTPTPSVVSSDYTMNSDGWTFNLSSNPVRAVLGFAFAIGDSATTPTITFDGPDVDTVDGTDGTPLPDPTPNPSMDSRFTVTGGTATYTLQDGTLPTGVTIDPATGNLVGTPTESGTFPGIIVRGTV